MRKGKIPQTIRFCDTTFSKLDELSKINHTSVNATVNRIVDDYFQRLENESNLTPQPMTEEEAQRLAECERGIVEIRNEISELKKLIISEKNKE